MKPIKSPHLGWLAGSLALALAFMSTPTTVRAYVYATDIHVGTALSGPFSDAVGTAVSITYHLNDKATTGCTVNILQAGVPVASIPGGTAMGLNTVSWTPTVAGSYTVSITASSAGYTNWQQYTPLDANHVAVFAHGMDVDQNANSAFYGRVIVGCATTATNTVSATSYQTAHSVAQACGFYKFNADGTPADEGSFGYAQYTTDDGGNISANNAPQFNGTANMMANGRAISGGANTLGNPVNIKIGEDDRIYWIDDSATGAVEACDIQAIGPAQDIISKAGYSTCPDDSQLNQGGDGWRHVDIINANVSSTSSGIAAVFISDFGDFPNAGCWMWHLVGTAGTMAADPTDTTGTQVIYAGGGSDNTLRVDGVAVDYNLDIFNSQDRVNSADPANRSIAYYNWPAVYGGTAPTLPPGGTGLTDAELQISTGGGWVAGSGDNTASGIYDTVINSKVNPTLVATPMQTGYTNLAGGYTGHNGGIRLYNAFNESLQNTAPVISSIVNNGTTITITCYCGYEPITASQLSLTSSGVVSGSPYSTPVPATFAAAANGNNFFTTTINSPVSTTFYQVGCAPTATGAGTIVVGTANTIDGSGINSNPVQAPGPVTATSLGNIDVANYYFCAAFDAVGNLYGATTTDNYWRAWSPPGPNTATTVAVATVSAH
jgi:hypothetical protein